MPGYYSRRRFLRHGSAVAGTSLWLKACRQNTRGAAGPGPAPVATNGSHLKLAIVLPGLISDQTWNQAGYEGAIAAAERIGAELSYVERAQADSVAALSDYARRGYQLVYAHGGQFDAALAQVASQFPKTFFIGVNSAVSGPNLASLRLDALQPSYLCGMIGATMSQSNQMAYLTAQPFLATDEELRGFELGAKSVKPDIKIASRYTGDWDDGDQARAMTETLIAAGADVIYPCLDRAAAAVLQTASERGAYAFGNTIDQFHVAPEAVLTSVIKRTDRAIATFAERYQQGELMGDIYLVGLEQPDLLNLGKFNAAVPKTVQNAVLAMKAAIASGEIRFEPCQEGDQVTRCVTRRAA